MLKGSRLSSTVYCEVNDFHCRKELFYDYRYFLNHKSCVRSSQINVVFEVVDTNDPLVVKDN